MLIRVGLEDLILECHGNVQAELQEGAWRKRQEAERAEVNHASNIYWLLY